MWSVLRVEATSGGRTGRVGCEIRLRRHESPSVWWALRMARSGSRGWHWSHVERMRPRTAVRHHATVHHMRRRRWEGEGRVRLKSASDWKVVSLARRGCDPAFAFCGPEDGRPAVKMERRSFFGAACDGGDCDPCPLGGEEGCSMRSNASACGSFAAGPPWCAPP